MPGARWFVGARLNYAENLLRHRGSAARRRSATGEGLRRPHVVTATTCATSSRAAQEGLRRLGVGRGDRVAAFTPNCLEAVVMMLATTALGAVWSSCSPDFGVKGVVDRFAQIEPRSPAHRRRLPLRRTTHTPAGQGRRRLRGAARPARTSSSSTSPGEDLRSRPAVVELRAAARQRRRRRALRAGRARPPAVHHVLLRHDGRARSRSSTATAGRCSRTCKEHRLHVDLHRRRRHLLVHHVRLDDVELAGQRPGDRRRDRAVRRQPHAPRLGDAVAAGRAAAASRTSGPARSSSRPARRRACVPSRSPISRAMRIAAVDGLAAEPRAVRLGLRRRRRRRPPGLDQRRHRPPRLLRRRRRRRCRCAAASCRAARSAWRSKRGTTSGRPVIGRARRAGLHAAVPVDAGRASGTIPTGERYRAAYFEQNPGVWTHGDFIEVRPSGGVVIHGRSDTTLNPGGVRIGTAEIYGAIETLPEIVDSIVVGRPVDGDVEVVLCVKLRDDQALDEELVARVQAHHPRDHHTAPRARARLRRRRHPVHDQRQEGREGGARHDHRRGVHNRDALANPESLDEFGAAAVPLISLISRRGTSGAPGGRALSVLGSTSTTDCHVPSAIRPSTTGMVTEGETISRQDVVGAVARRPVPVHASDPPRVAAGRRRRARHRPPCPRRARTAATPAVACGTNTVHNPSPRPLSHCVDLGR